MKENDKIEPNGYSTAAKRRDNTGWHGISENFPILSSTWEKWKEWCIP